MKTLKVLLKNTNNQIKIRKRAVEVASLQFSPDTGWKEGIIPLGDFMNSCWKSYRTHSIKGNVFIALAEKFWEGDKPHLQLTCENSKILTLPIEPLKSLIHFILSEVKRGKGRGNKLRRDFSNQDEFDLFLYYFFKESCIEFETSCFKEE